jgi:hypothetical protein
MAADRRMWSVESPPDEPFYAVDGPPEKPRLKVLVIPTGYDHAPADWPRRPTLDAVDGLAFATGWLNAREPPYFRKKIGTIGRYDLSDDAEGAGDAYLDSGRRLLQHHENRDIHYTWTQLQAAWALLDDPSYADVFSRISTASTGDMLTRIRMMTKAERSGFFAAMFARPAKGAMMTPREPPPGEPALDCTLREAEFAPAEWVALDRPIKETVIATDGASATGDSAGWARVADPLITSGNCTVSWATYEMPSDVVTVYPEKKTGNARHMVTRADDDLENEVFLEYRSVRRFDMPLLRPVPGCVLMPESWEQANEEALSLARARVWSRSMVESRRPSRPTDNRFDLRTPTSAGVVGPRRCAEAVGGVPVRVVPGSRTRLRELNGRPVVQVGSIMSPDQIRAQPHWRSDLRAQLRDGYDLFFAGRLSARELLLAAAWRNPARGSTDPTVAKLGSYAVKNPACRAHSVPRKSRRGADDIARTTAIAGRTSTLPGDGASRARGVPVRVFEMNPNSYVVLGSGPGDLGRLLRAKAKVKGASIKVVHWGHTPLAHVTRRSAEVDPADAARRLALKAEAIPPSESAGGGPGEPSGPLSAWLRRNAREFKLHEGLWPRADHVLDSAREGAREASTRRATSPKRKPARPSGVSRISGALARVPIDRTFAQTPQTAENPATAGAAAGAGAQATRGPMPSSRKRRRRGGQGPR